MRNFIKEFKEFAFKGSLVDLAVGIIIGGAVSKLVGSLVADIIMPIIGMIFGGNVDFTNLVAGPAGQIRYGNFLTMLVDFIILAFILFLIIKSINRVIRKEEVAAPPSNEELLLMEIRDELKRK